MNVLITGACGFIGRNLIRELEDNHQLRLLDQTAPAEATIFAGATRTAIPLETDWPFIQADITDLAAMQEAMVGMDAVIHLAGLSNDPLGDYDPTLTDRINHIGSVKMAKAARPTP